MGKWLEKGWKTGKRKERRGALVGDPEAPLKRLGAVFYQNRPISETEKTRAGAGG
jgi:hypothetical protein